MDLLCIMFSNLHIFIYSNHWTHKIQHLKESKMNFHVPFTSILLSIRATIRNFIVTRPVDGGLCVKLLGVLQVEWNIFSPFMMRICTLRVQNRGRPPVSTIVLRKTQNAQKGNVFVEHRDLVCQSSPGLNETTGERLFPTGTRLLQLESGGIW